MKNPAPLGFICLLVAIFGTSCVDTNHRAKPSESTDSCAEYDLVLNHNNLRRYGDLGWIRAIVKLEDEIRAGWASVGSFGRVENSNYVVANLELKAELLRNRIIEDGTEEYDRYSSRKRTILGLVQNLEAERIRANSCFDGSRFEEQYTQILAATNSALSIYEREVTVGLSQWETSIQSNQKMLTALAASPESDRSQMLGDFLYAVVNIGRQKNPASIKNKVIVRVTNRSQGVVIRPQFVGCWGHDAESPMIGGCYDKGLSLRDDFKNRYRLAAVDPKLNKTGIQPGQTVDFEAQFDEMIPRTVSQVWLVIEANVLGNKKAIELAMPRAALYPDMTFKAE